MPSKRPETTTKPPASVPDTTLRVRRRRDVSGVFIHGHGVIEPGAFTDAISIDEARQRADFEVVSDHDDQPPAPPSDPASEEVPDGLSESR